MDERRRGLSSPQHAKGRSAARGDRLADALRAARSRRSLVALATRARPRSTVGAVPTTRLVTDARRRALRLRRAATLTTAPRCWSCARRPSRRSCSGAASPSTCSTPDGCGRRAAASSPRRRRTGAAATRRRLDRLVDSRRRCSLVARRARDVRTRGRMVALRCSPIVVDGEVIGARGCARGRPGVSRRLFRRTRTG